MAVEANLMLDMFDSRLSEYTSCFGGVRLATSERTSIDSRELPYPIENPRHDHSLSGSFA
jgi:hypothetical protein